MTTTILSTLDLSTPATAATFEQPREAQPACLQEQFLGRLPLRGERPMVEILAERMARADSCSPCPVFIP